MSGFLQQLGADRQLLADRQVPAAPAADHGHDRHELDGLLGQAVDGLLLVRGIVGACDHPLGFQLLHPVGEDVGGDALLRLAQQLAEMPAVAEHHVADNDQAPAIAEDFEAQIDGATGSLLVAHGGL